MGNSWGNATHHASFAQMGIKSVVLSPSSWGKPRYPKPPLVLILHPCPQKYAVVLAKGPSKPLVLLNLVFYVDVPEVL